MPLTSDQHLITLSNQILEQFDALFGVHPGFRPAHAKGVLLNGTFTPSSQAASLSRAPHFNRPSTNVTVRFSNSTGVPMIPDSDANANPRGMAVRFNLADHVHTDIIAHGVDGFATRTPEEFLELLQAVVATGKVKPTEPGPKPIEAFLGSHPKALSFVQMPKPFPSSFARQTYFGVTAMHFSNNHGDTQFGRYRIVPSAGNDPLDEAAAKTKPANYLFDEMKDRMGKGPVEFELLAQLAAPGDVVDDATTHWPADRTLLPLGKIVLTEPEANDEAEQKKIIFDPIPRVDGIEPSNDPLLDLRAAIYLISGKKRRAAT